MNYGIYVSAEGAMAQTMRMEVLSNNLANVGTTGFKRDLALCQARAAEEIQRQQDHPGSHSLNQLGGGVMTYSTTTDYSNGPLKETGVGSDLALAGEGFFVVQRNGQDFLTRAGNFSVTPDGRLITQDGDSVMGATGEPVQIDPDPAAPPWHFTADGQLQQGLEVQPLAIVTPASLGDLVKVGENRFSPLSPVAPLDESQRRVQSGFLEMSGLKPTTEMMELLQTSRAFEANVNMIRNQDQMYGTLISRVLKA